MSYSSRLFLYQFVLLLTVLTSAHYRYRHKHVLALRDVDGLGEFQNRVPRNILPAKRNKVRQGYRKLHNIEPHDLSDSSNTIRVIKEVRIR